MVVALIAYPVAGMILGFVDFAPNHQKVELVFAIVSQGVVTAAAMLTLRGGGFRLAKLDDIVTASGSLDVSVLESEGPGDGL